MGSASLPRHALHGFLHTEGLELEGVAEHLVEVCLDGLLLLQKGVSCGIRIQLVLVDLRQAYLLNVLRLLQASTVPFELAQLYSNKFHFFGFAKTVAALLDFFGSGFVAPLYMGETQVAVHLTSQAVRTILDDGFFQQGDLEVVMVHCLLNPLFLLPHLLKLLTTHLPLLVLHAQVPPGMMVAAPGVALVRHH